MKISTVRILMPFVAMVGFGAAHCGGEDLTEPLSGESGRGGSEPQGAGGSSSGAGGSSSGSGGATGKGGTTGSGGAPGSGGATGSGGAVGTGGATGTGGSGGMGTGGEDAGASRDGGGNMRCPATAPMSGESCTATMNCPYDSETCACGRERDGGQAWTCTPTRDAGVRRDAGRPTFDAGFPRRDAGRD
jgi:two-component system chemotaxis sensor kinase CheA